MYKTILNQNEKKATGYDYGLTGLSIFLNGRDWGWEKPDENHKKVILVNPDDCREKINGMGLISIWRGTGHSEWEALLAKWFIEAVKTAIENGEKEADITHMFNRDFLASKNRVFTKEQVYDHLIKWFSIVKDSDEELKVRFRI